MIRCYSNGEGRTIVFTETKKDATELAVALADSASALHGDIAQAQREVRENTTLFAICLSVTSSLVCNS